jgi:hypothetical protein
MFHRHSATSAQKPRVIYLAKIFKFRDGRPGHADTPVEGHSIIKAHFYLTDFS